MQLIKFNTYAFIALKENCRLETKKPLEGFRACESNIPKVASVLTNPHLAIHSVVCYFNTCSVIAL
jgi:hypothetical protein